MTLKKNGTSSTALKTNFKKFFIITVGLFTAIDVASAKPLQLDLTPYLWAMSMNGRVQTGNRAAHVDQSFSDILKQLDGAVMIYVDAKKDKFGVYGNAMYAVVSNGAGGRRVSLHVKNRYGIFGAGITYEIYKYCFSNSWSCDLSSIAFEPYVGFRYTVNNTRIDLDTRLSRFDRTANIDQHWTDPIVGLKLTYVATKAWSAILSGDIGGRNGSTQYSYNVFGVVGYQPQTILKCTKFYLGYRILDQHYETGSGRKFFDWNMKLFGPVIGVDFRL